MRIAINVWVVLAVLLVTAMMLLAGVQQVRVAAARMTCANHLRQLSLAVHNYNDSNHGFPQAGDRRSSPEPNRRLSWIIELPPYMYGGGFPTQRLDRERGWDADENRYLALSPLHVAECPASKAVSPNRPLFPTHYVGIAGIGDIALELTSRDDPRAGMFGFERTLNLPQLEDRSATLLMLIETERVFGAWTAAGPPTARGLEDGSPLIGADSQFGGRHGGGANVAFADASVRFVRSSVNPEVLRAAATLSGSQGLSPPDSW